MLPAIGAASLVLDAIQSLTSPSSSSSSSSSQAAGFGSTLPDAGDNSASFSATISGSTAKQISSDNISALIDAQSLASGGLADALGSSSSPDSSSSQSASASANASSAYNSVNQLVQSTAVPLGFSPVSLNA